jgi:NAD/NADP transhydrogenase beta subunit
VTSQAAGPVGLPQAARSGHHIAIVMIGLAVAARLARDTRTYEPAIVVAIAVVAVAGLGRASRARAFTRLVAWDQRRNANLHRGRERGEA